MEMRVRDLKTYTAGLQGKGSGLVLRLQKGFPVTLDGDHRGQYICSQAGAVWVSQTGDPYDYVLTGESCFQITKLGKVVVESFDQSVAVIQ